MKKIKKIQDIKNEINSLKLEREKLSNQLLINITDNEILKLETELKTLEDNKKKKNKRDLNFKIGSLKEKLKEATIKNDLEEYKRTEKELKELKTIARSLKNKIEFLTIEQIKNILIQIDIHSNNKERDKLLIMLGFELGLRAREVLDLRISDIYIDTGEVICRRNKNSEHNRLMLDTDTLAILKSFLKERIALKLKHDFIFLNNKATPLKYTGLNYIVKRYFSLAEINEDLRHFHVLKHSRGIWLAEQEVPLQTIKYLLGHKSIRNTLVYASYTPVQNENIVTKIKDKKVWR